MTKEEAITFIENCSKSLDGSVGFIVVSVAKPNIAENASEEFYEDLYSKPKEEQEVILSRIADELTDTYVEWDFDTDLRSVISDRTTSDDFLD